MKYFILLLAAVVLAQAEDDFKPLTPDQFNDIRRECHKEHPFSEELQRKEDVFDYPDELLVRKYLVCVYTKWGIFNEESGYNENRIVKQMQELMSKEEVEDILKNCMDNNEQGSSTDVWAYRIHHCVLKTKVSEKFLAFVGKLSK